jgi:hypothetical protein
MMSLTFNKRSWHYAIAKFGGFDSYEDQDLCTYTSKFLKGVFWGSMLACLIAAVGFAAWHFIFGIIFSILAGEVVMSEIGVVFGILVLVLLLFVAIAAGAEKYRESREFRPQKPDGFVKNAYKGWKEKFCVKINIVDQK